MGHMQPTGRVFKTPDLSLHEIINSHFTTFPTIT